MASPAGKKTSQPFGYRPLYRQVKDILRQRIGDGVWQAGQIIPSEPELASDIGVSPGTVRKALDEMTAENLLVRKQGRGTFVTRHDDARILFQFFKLMPDEGECQFPDSRILHVKLEPADEAAAKLLNVRKGNSLVLIERIRTIAGEPCIFERILLPRTLFPEIEKRELPNNLYNLYSTEYGVTIAGASERLKAVAATRREANHLGVATGTPLLLINRVAQTVNGAPAEWRISFCRTDRVHYLSDLR